MFKTKKSILLQIETRNSIKYEKGIHPSMFGIHGGKSVRWNEISAV
jgi:hypothetical protein